MPHQEKVIDIEKGKLPKGLIVEGTTADSPLYEPYFERPYNPDKLYRQKGNYDLFDDMREDDQIAALLHLKKLIILDSSWVIESENEELKDFLTDNLNNVHEGIIKKMYDMLSALDYGFSITEKLYKADNGKIILWDMKTRAPHSFEKIEQDSMGNITAFIQDTGQGEIEVNPRKIIHFLNQKEFDNPFGKSELNRGVYTDWWSKHHIIKFWNIFIERFGSPTVVGTYEPNLRDQRDEILKVSKNLQVRTGIALPKGIELQLLESENDTGEVFEKAINYYNMSIARKMLIPDLMGMGGSETSGGSYSLGREHFGIFFNIINQVRNDIERTINIELIAELTAWNFGPSEKAKFTFVESDAGKKERQLNFWLDFIGKGHIPQKNEIDWFFNQIEAPSPFENDENVEKSLTKKMKKGIKAQRNKSGDDNQGIIVWGE